MQYPALIQPLPLPEPRAGLPRVLANNVLELPFGAHSHVAVSSGKVAAFLAYSGYDRKNDVATYALRILNDSAFEVRAQLTCILKDGSSRSASPLTMKVPPFSMRDDYVPVRLDITGRFERAIVEVHSDETYFSVEAPAPAFPVPKWLRWCWIPLAPALLAATTAGIMTPRVAPLAAPERVFAGTSMAIPYEASGYGNVEYSLSDRNHVQLYAGIAPSSSGVLHFSIPARANGSPYTVHIRLRSSFGSAEQVATVAAIAPPDERLPKAADPRPLIDELRVEPSAVRAGHDLTISYATRTNSGDLSLVDASGATWIRQPLSPDGKSVITVPAATAGKAMRVVLHAQRGKQQAQSSVETIVLASDAIASPQRDTSAPTTAPQQPQSGATMTLSSSVVAGGDDVTVRVSGMHGDVRITVVDRTGTTVAEGDGSQGATSISAPVVQSVTKYFVVATFTDGAAEQSVLKTLTVTPR